MNQLIKDMNRKKKKKKKTKELWMNKVKAKSHHTLHTGINNNKK